MTDIRFAPGVVARCVRCGALLDKRTVQQCAMNGLPPGCDECFDEIMEEDEKGFSMWPHDWYGHAYTDLNDKWMIVQDKAV